MGRNRRTGAVSEDDRRRRIITIVVVLAIAVFLAGFAALVFFDSRQQAASGSPEGVEEIDVGQAGQHTEGQVDYGQSPPAGGEHNPVWQNAGFYSEPVGEENAVHTLEHGAVWITYRPDLPQEQVERLREIASSNSCVLVSPYEGLSSPIVASAWGYQLELESADDSALDQFVRSYLRGPQTPEPGASCTGGVGSPT